MEPLAAFIQSNPTSQELKRALAVQMVQQGYSYREIQQVLQVSLGFISKWKQVYQTQGVAGLKLGYWGTVGYLTLIQKQAIVEWLESHNSWNLEELVLHVEQYYGVVFQSKQSYYALLHTAGLSWKKSQPTRPQKDAELVAQKNEKSSTCC